MKTKFIILIFFISASSYAQTAPRKISYNNLVWFGDFSKINLNDKWSIYFDFGLRRTDWLNKWSQTLVRPGLTYALNANTSITAGVAWFNNYTSTYIKPEYRGWQQILFTENYGRVKVNNRLRAEQRFNQNVVKDKLVNTFVYTNRFRYQLNVQVALNKPNIDYKTLYLVFADEVMINCGKEVSNYFDQNRLSAGVGYKLNDLFNITISYMNVFVQKSTINTFENN
ncbi:MAG: DUF2490 domain-containing protein, partial [Bacteroidia bacterium]